MTNYADLADDVEGEDTELANDGVLSDLFDCEDAEEEVCDEDEDEDEGTKSEDEEG